MFQKTNSNKQIGCATNSSVTVTSAASQLGRAGREYVLVNFNPKYWWARDLNTPKDSPKFLQNMLYEFLTHFKGVVCHGSGLCLCVLYEAVVYMMEELPTVTDCFNTCVCMYLCECWCQYRVTFSTSRALIHNNTHTHIKVQPISHTYTHTWVQSI